jgi:hypothetical protein
MLPPQVKSQTDELRKRLPEYGWEIVEIEPPFEDEWWSAEFWIIESVWSPRGVRVYFTFEVDPMGESDDIWALTASRERPGYRPSGGNPSMGMGHGWQKELRAFLGSLDQFRAESAEE